MDPLGYGACAFLFGSSAIPSQTPGRIQNIETPNSGGSNTPTLENIEPKGGATFWEFSKSGAPIQTPNSGAI